MHGLITLHEWRERYSKGRFLKNKYIPKFAFGRNMNTPASTNSLVGKHIKWIYAGAAVRRTLVIQFKRTPTLKEATTNM